tara:strand:- start:1925 stop:2392 length:468 start_codon:yes stop_codon:yes gene_type:complete
MKYIRTKTQNKVFKLMDLPKDIKLDDWVKASGLTFDQLDAPNRADNLVVWRQLIMAYFHGIGETVTFAGRIFGKDHSTALYACESICNGIETNETRITSRIEALKDYKGITDYKDKIASKIMSDHYTRATNNILDYETKQIHAWVLDAINEALNK